MEFKKIWRILFIRWCLNVMAIFLWFIIPLVILVAYTSLLFSIMEPDHQTHKASKIAAEDIISKMPVNVVARILDHLPIQDSVRTSILSRTWRFNWTNISQLVFDEKLFEPGLQGNNKFNARTISRLLLYFKGPVTKFFLHIPHYMELDVADVCLWVMFLSKKGIKEFTLINMHPTPLKLPSHLFCCLELKLLELQNCCFHMPPTFCGFPKLLTLKFNMVRFESGNVGELITRCPLLEKLKIRCNYPTGGNEINWDYKTWKSQSVIFAFMQPWKYSYWSYENLWACGLSSKTSRAFSGFSKLQGKTNLVLILQQQQQTQSRRGRVWGIWFLFNLQNITAKLYETSKCLIK